jgi:hypothetical protein
MIVRAKTVTAVLERKTLKQLNSSTEITLRLADNIGLISKKCFANAIPVKNLFHIQINISDNRIKTKASR